MHRMAGTLSFSNDGPDFPGDFVDSLLSGDVIFLCGTGVSAPQMPSFQRLVENTYSETGVAMTDSEKRSFDQGRFEEVLGSLSRRLSDPDAVAATVSDLLAVPDDPELDQHRTILRLSRAMDNRVSVVTTNFDTLLEQAVAKFTGEDIASFAGQSIPAPGTSAFSGIIHIHGRLADRTLGLESTPLVLSSADYGDAYMRSGWVSRFLFDLARCKTIVLVGYSASDAPVRYFLNVLEADRMRFPDLKPVYAFDAYEHDPEEASTAWGTLAVTPLPYRKASSHDHSLLWCDLAALAEVVDRPIPWQSEQATNILNQTVANADTKVREKVRWLFGRKHDLWSVAIKPISDPKWFDVFEEEHLWSPKDAIFVIAAWIARDFEDRARLECASEWQRRLGSSFTAAVERQLLSHNNVDRTWLRMWRLVCGIDPPIIDLWKEINIATRRLKSDVTVDGDLERAVRLLAPSLVLEKKQQRIQPIKRLSDIFWTRMRIPNSHSNIQELIDTLCKQKHALRTLELATAQLQSTLYLEADLELITEEHDYNDFTVPSIEPHTQNRHRDGVYHLVRLLVELLPAAVAMDRERTRDVIFSWKSLPGRIGLRLCLHAMRNTAIFDADEAMSTILTASDVDFWLNKREVPLLLKDRAGAASPKLTSQVEDRIIYGALKFYESHFKVGPEEVDWREHARDNRVWLHLTMLQKAGGLSPTGTTELLAIRKRRIYLDRTVEDRDFFGSYVFGARAVAGDPVPIAEAAGDDRLRVASELRRGPELEQRLGWSEYCRNDPQGAFDVLAKGDLSSANGALWNDFLIGIGFGHEASKPARDDLAVKSFDHLADASDESLRPMAFGLASLLMHGPRQRIADVDRWLRRLWNISTQLQSPLGHSTNVYELAINEVSGKIAHTLLSEIDARKQNDIPPTAAQFELLSNISRHMGTSGQLGRAILTYDLSFVISVSQPSFVDVLKDRIEASDEEGESLRAVMLSNRITAQVTRELRDAVLEGAIESKADDATAHSVAANILRPALASVSRAWGLTASDVALVLRNASQNIRIAALEVLQKWISDKNTNGELFWHDTLASFFDNVWPKEREFLDVSLTDSFIGLVIAAGDEFPAALKRLNPYMVPFDGGSHGLCFISSSQAPENFPDDVLSLLWKVCGPDSRGIFYMLSDIIDRLTKADPKLEVDRRMQWLEHRTERYN